MITTALLVAVLVTPAGAASDTTTIALVSDTPGGDTANGISVSSTASADGHFVAFRSTAADLIPGLEDHNGRFDVFLLDLESGALQAVSLAHGGTATGNGESYPLDVSDNGQFVVFSSYATDLVAGMTGASENSNTYLWDRNSGATTLVSHASNSPLASGNANASGAYLSAAGNLLAFSSFASNLVSGVADSNQSSDVFLFDRISGGTALISTSATSPQVAAAGASYVFALSADGNQVYFQSDAAQLIAGTSNGQLGQLYRHDRTTNSTKLLTHSVGAPSVGANWWSRGKVITPDGRFVVFESDATDLVAGFPPIRNDRDDVYLYDTTTSSTTLVSHSASLPSVGAGIGAVGHAISEDGSLVFFSSASSNLVAGTSYPIIASNAFVYDRLIDQSRLLSGSAAERRVAANGSSFPLSTSPDGRYVLLESTATNLAGGVSDANAGTDVYLLDRDSGTRRLLSHAAGQAQLAANSTSTAGVVRADGSRASYFSAATNLLAGTNDANARDDLFLFEASAPESHVVSRRSGAAVATANRESTPAALSADGRYVLITTDASNFSSAVIDTNELADVYLVDRQHSTKTLLSHAAATATRAANAWSGGAALSGDGRFAVIRSEATDLIPGFVDQNGPGDDVYVYDREADALILVSHAAGDPARSANAQSGPALVSQDGRYVVFQSLATDLVSGTADTNSTLDVFLHNRQDGSTQLVSRSATADNASANGFSLPWAISIDGRYVLFESVATDLLAGFVNANDGERDAFLFDRVEATTRLVSHALASELVGGNGQSQPTALSGDGRFAVFSSTARDLVGSGLDLNEATDVFLYDGVTGSVQLVTHTPASLGSANGTSYARGISDDGSVVLVESYASNLVSGFVDGNGGSRSDAYLFDRYSDAMILVSRASDAANVGGNGYSAALAVNRDGSRIVVRSAASNLVANQTDTNADYDLFVYERGAAATRLLSHAWGSDSMAANGASDRPLINPSGDTIVFRSLASDLVRGVGDGNIARDVYAAEFPLFHDGFE